MLTHYAAWIRVILCSGPRQVVNGLTLRSVYIAELAGTGDFTHSFEAFFNNIKTLAQHNYEEAVILSGMCFTLVIWVFSALFLLAAVLFYVFFLFHWIPRADGGLSGYCERKVNKALREIVTKKVNKALVKEESSRIKAELRAARKNGETPQLSRMATGTLPTLPNVGLAQDDKLPGKPMLGRNDTMATLPPYESRPGTPGSFELGSLEKRPMATRTATSASSASYSSRAPLISSAADMGYGPSASPEPTLPEIDLSNLPPRRPGTSSSQRSFGGRPTLGHINTNSGSSLRTPITETPGAISESPFAPPSSTTNYSMGQDGRPGARPGPKQYRPYNPGGNTSPTASLNSYSSAPPGGARQQGSMDQRPYQPMRSATGPVPLRGPQNPPHRNLTTPVPPRGLQPAFQPQSPVQRNMSTPMPSRGPQLPYQSQSAVQRNMSTPMPPRGPQHPPQRTMTAPMAPQGPVNDYFEGAPSWQNSRGPPSRQNYGPPQGQGGDPYGYDVESQRSRGY